MRAVESPSAYALANHLLTLSSAEEIALYTQLK
jgi:hypothetical protein